MGWLDDFFFSPTTVDRFFSPTTPLDDPSLISPPSGWPLPREDPGNRVRLFGELRGKRVRLTGPPTTTQRITISKAGMVISEDPIDNAEAARDCLGWKIVKGFILYQRKGTDTFVCVPHWWSEQDNTWIDLTPRPMRSAQQMVLVESSIRGVTEVDDKLFEVESSRRAAGPPADAPPDGASDAPGQDRRPPRSRDSTEPPRETIGARLKREMITDSAQQGVVMPTAQRADSERPEWFDKLAELGIELPSWLAPGSDAGEPRAASAATSGSSSSNDLASSAKGVAVKLALSALAVVTIPAVTLDVSQLHWIEQKALQVNVAPIAKGASVLADAKDSFAAFQLSMAPVAEEVAALSEEALEAAAAAATVAAAPLASEVAKSNSNR